MQQFRLSHTYLLFLLFPACFVSQISLAQDTFEWYEGTCLYSGKIDTTKASYEQVMNVYYTILNPNDLSKPFLAYKPADTVYLKVENIEKEQNSYTKEYAALSYPDDPFWKKIKEQKIKEINALCELRKTTILALKEPKVLKKSPYYKTCREVCNALIKGGDELLEQWKALQAAQYADAYDPEIVKAAFQYMWDSPDRELYARMELLRYVWYKCASEQIAYAPVNSAVFTRFRDLMSDVHSGCH